MPTTMPIYRAVPRANFVAGQEIRRNPGRRLPSNLSYLVDNLWEFTRPADMPSRRHAVYASPTPELALENASGEVLDRDQYVACRVEFHRQPAMIQLTKSDARHHDDARKLQPLVNRLLKELGADDIGSKRALAPLFLPGMARDELLAAMAAEPALDRLVRTAAAAVTLWWPNPGDVSPDGELFFEIADDNFYKLYPV